MPAAVVAVAAGAAATVATGWAVGAGLVVAGGIGASIIGAVASTVVGSVLSSALTPSRQQAQQQTAVQAATGIQVNAESQSSPLYTVYGETRIGGTRMVIGASGTNNEYLHLIVAHCEGEVYAAPTLYIGDLPYTDSKFDGLIHWEFFTGTDDQQVCQTLLNAGVGWKATSRGRGVAYSYVRLKYKQEAFSGIPQITVKLRGRIVFDPRSNARAWSENPALCLRDYLINPRFGRGIPLELIDETYIISAANTCDSTYADTGGTSRKLHTCNGVTNPDTSTLENVRGMMTTCRGRLVYSARGYSLIVDKARASTFAFTPDNIVGAWQISLPGKRTMRNKVVGAWVNPADLYKEDLYPAESTAFRTLDNGVMLESRIELPFTQNSFEAQMLCDRELRQSRIGIQVSFRAFMSALTCEVGDVVTITHPTPGWTAKPFDVTRITLLSDDEVQVDCREYDSIIYDPHVLTAPRTTYTTLLPDPQLVPAFTSLSLSSGTDVLQVMPDGTIVSRIKVEWAAPTQIYLDAGQIEVQFKPTAADKWMSVLSHASTEELFLAPVKDGVLYDVRARWVNEFNRRGAWQAVQHSVIGKTAPPENVTGFGATIGEDRVILSWASVSDVDLAEYEIRQGASWDTASLVGRVKATTIKVFANYAGVRTWLIKAIDTSGNYSVTATAVTATISAAPATTIRVQIIDNNVLLYWTETHGTLRTATFEIRKGADYASAEVLGTKDGLFTVLFETRSGEYKYWITPIDAAGNYGTSSYVNARVNQPPDYILFSERFSTFGGTKTNVLNYGNGALLPVNAARTWSQRFTTNGWLTPQAKINAGYPVYIQPTQSTASYIEVIDYGTVLPGFKTAVELDIVHHIAGAEIECSLESSADGVTWSTAIPEFSAFFSNFRYLRITLTATSSDVGHAVAEIKSAKITLDAKRKTWGGKIACNAADSGGTVVYLTDDGTATGNLVFIDVQSLTPGATGTASVTPVFDFVDTPYPLSFKALLFNAAGARISGTVYYSAIGI